MLEKKFFGLTQNNQEVYSYTLKNKFLKIEVLNLGGIIKNIIILDEDREENIVLAYDKVESYEKSPTYFGAITGRVAGRIKNAHLKLKGQDIYLEKNDGENNLHGGFNSLNSKLWEVTTTENENEIVLSYVSPHMENNFPAEIKFEVKYTLEGRSLVISYLGIPDRETYINLTNHTYFNLSGDAKKNILDEKIQIMADKFIRVDKNIIPIGISEVYGSFDLRESRDFRNLFLSKDEQILNAGVGIDHGFVLNENSTIKARYEDSYSGRILEIETDQPVIVMYTGNYLENTPNLENNKIAQKYLGVCLETQDYPDIQNLIMDKMKIYSPTQHYKQKTKYKFIKK